MNWPLVTRSRLEYEQRHVKLLKTMLAEIGNDFKNMREALLHLRKWEDERYDKLVKTIVDMKRDGFESTPESIELIPEKELPVEIWEAINEVSAKGSRDYYENMAHAHEAIEAGVKPGDIIHTIIYGQEVDL